MPAEKAFEGLIDREEREDGARVREHHHKPGAQADAAADTDRPEGAPVHLCLFGRQRREAPIDGGRRGWMDQTNGAPQLHDRAPAAGPFDHVEEPRRAQPRILRERVTDERQLA